VQFKHFIQGQNIVPGPVEAGPWAYPSPCIWCVFSTSQLFGILRAKRANIIAVTLEKEGILIHIQRAQEIAASPVMAHVTYNGAPIYIQHVDEKNELARVYLLDRPEHEIDVPLQYLEEG